MSGRFPFGIPTGWFSVGYTSELNPGDLKPLHYFDKHLILFRDEHGKACVLDAFCPHLGAHLGHGGTVTDGKVACPFHAWEFDGQGKCAHIPYGEKIPKRASLKAWEVQEKNGHIYVWHDEAGRDPMWFIPELPEYESDEWRDLRTAKWTINTCNQEMAENQVDAAHFLYVHGTAAMPVTTTERKGHQLVSVSTTKLTTPMGPVDGQIEVNAWGFGFSTTRFTGLVETLLMAAATPIDAETTEMSFGFTMRKDVMGGVGKAFMAEVKRQLEQDMPIWENKRYVSPPLLCDGDGPIGIFRQWSKQFYPPADSGTDQAQA